MKIDKFCEIYPLVFPDGAPEGIHCGDGWFQLLDSLFFVINKELSSIPVRAKLAEQTEFATVAQRNFKILQIKEKFGRLTIYCEGATEYIRDTIAQAEEMSEQICETCGEYGILRDSARWIKVRCDECEEKHFADRYPLSPEARKALEEGIESAKNSKPVYLGSFAQYADDDED